MIGGSWREVVVGGMVVSWEVEEVEVGVGVVTMVTGLETGGEFRGRFSPSPL